MSIYCFFATTITVPSSNNILICTRKWIKTFFARKFAPSLNNTTDCIATDFKVFIMTTYNNGMQSLEPGKCNVTKYRHIVLLNIDKVQLHCTLLLNSFEYSLYNGKMLTAFSSTFEFKQVLSLYREAVHIMFLHKCVPLKRNFSTKTKKSIIFSAF